MLIEAIASGLPVAASPVTGPLDVIGPAAGALDADLRGACLEALKVSRETAREYSLRFTWKESARQFLENVEAAPREAHPGQVETTARTGRRRVSGGRGDDRP